MANIKKIDNLTGRIEKIEKEVKEMIVPLSEEMDGLWEYERFTEKFEELEEEKEKFENVLKCLEKVRWALEEVRH